MMGEQGGGRTIVVWFRRDLRLHDHPALAAALRDGARVLPLFVFDEGLLGGRWPAPNRLWFMREAVRALGDDLAARGGRLCVRLGRPEAVVPEIAAATGAEAVYATRDYGPYARARDARVARALDARGIRFAARRGLLVREPEELLTNDGGPFAVFAPYRRRWEALPPREPLPAPRHIPTPADPPTGKLPSLADLGCAGPTARDIPTPSEAAARARLAAWARGGLAEYDTGRDLLAIGGTSRLSQDLHWGLLSPVAVVAATHGDGAGPEAYRSEIAWRDFYHQLLFHHPRIARAPFNPRYQELRWRDDAAELAAWREGRTGYPVVDAAMRQLVALGWMHNRARMITASFLTKHLLADYRVGERFFMEHLTDGDLALNNAGWQWAASVGAHAQPYFRIFNPTPQGQRHDPDGNFVRRWVPELARVPTAHIHQPWTMPEAVQRETGCRIGTDYPAPIVDHAEARARALALFKA